MFLEKDSYGGSIVSNINLNAIKKVQNIDVHTISLARTNSLRGDDRNDFLFCSSSRLRTALSNLTLYAGRLSGVNLNKIKEIILQKNPDIIYLDSSFFGLVAKWVKRKLPHIEVICFFHNVEFDFEMSRLKSGGLHFFPSLIASYYSELLTICYSDKIVSLHQKESQRLKSLYKRSADYLIPVCIGKSSVNVKPECGDIFKVGFLGTAFFANVEAAKYITKYIAPRFNSNEVEFIIAGAGFDKYDDVLLQPNVKVVGYVESLTKFYKDVNVMLLPIFSGAGMKVKVAEAMSYNKPIIASPFCLFGYEESVNMTSVISCQNLEEFIIAISMFKDSKNIMVNTEALFERNHSFGACISYFNNMLNE